MMKCDQIFLRDGSVLHKNELIDIQLVGGGCINDTSLWTFGDKRKVFVKENLQAPKDFFACETRGLKLLSSIEDGPVVPQVLYCSETLLILQYLPLISDSVLGDVDLAKRLARLHSVPTQHFGGDQDNYIGMTKQINGIYHDGATFYREQRIVYLQEKARSLGLLPIHFDKHIDAICAKMEQFCPEESPVVVHGDLWSGNWSFVVSDDGTPQSCIFDPAAYCGYRESDLAMMRLFGSLSSRFWDVYTTELPIQDGYERRELVFQLYHILNHVILFGTSYHRMLSNHISMIKAKT